MDVDGACVEVADAIDRIFVSFYFIALNLIACDVIVSYIGSPIDSTAFTRGAIGFPEFCLLDFVVVEFTLILSVGNQPRELRNILVHTQFQKSKKACLSQFSWHSVKNKG